MFSGQGKAYRRKRRQRDRRYPPGPVPSVAGGRPGPGKGSGAGLLASDTMTSVQEGARTMRLFSSKAGRLVAPLALTLLLGGSAYAFMASNTVNASSAGVGSGTITGYTVSNIQYTLSGQNGDPDNITQVQFSLTPNTTGQDQAADQVAVWFDNNPGNVASSTAPSGQTPACVPNGSAASDGTTQWTCTINWSQEAGPNQSDTLNVAAAH
jgi:hypothetical protein